MSYFNAIEYCPDGKSPFSSHGVTLPRPFIDVVGPEETTIFFLMGQNLKGPEGFWYPYIRTLPREDDITALLYYEEEDLAWLNGTSLYQAREQRIQEWRSSYDNGMKILRDSGMEKIDDHSWELYLWASTIIASRGFSSEVLTGILDKSELPAERMSVLLPLVDIANHQPLAKVEWQAGRENIGFVVMEDIAAGQEIGNNYGPRDNGQLMLNYGFCIPENPCEYRSVRLKSPPGSPLDYAKTRQLQQFPRLKQGTEDRYYVFNISYPLSDSAAPIELAIFSPNLFHAVSILAANDRELETLEITENSIQIPSHIYGNSRNSIATLSQILMELITHAVKLKASGMSLKEPKNFKQHSAKTYRESQIMLSQIATVVADWALTWARNRDAVGAQKEKESCLDDYLSRVPSAIFSEKGIGRVRSKVLQHRSLVENVGELFQYEDLFTIIPCEMQESCRNNLHNILVYAEDPIGSLEIDDPAAMFSFSLFLCWVVAAYKSTTASTSRDNLISPRLTKWCCFLFGKYPVPSDDVSWELPEEEEAILGRFDDVLDNIYAQEPELFRTNFHAIRSTHSDDGKWWVSPNWLRWAWLVLGQETVNILSDPLLHLLEDKCLALAGPRELSTTCYLYIPQI
ncbi:hypothetical protein Egran_04700 [Elaphomyces granulatus]|uniref:SET domain-containing protein n=1 Tax=Elaphomyces granulatus TaxID=519963 RepID=A0A232LTQ0_9EURO|nr:hypothetical protein Egran_04700 [Elaphomyces granulatus]